MPRQAPDPLIAGEYGVKYLRLTGLGALAAENVQVALERKRLPASSHADDTWIAWGRSRRIAETLTTVMSPGR